MKRTVRRIATVLASAVIAASMFTGCSGKSSSSSKETNLVMYVIGDRPAGQDVADDAFNVYLKEKMNCTLTVNWIPWSDFANKYPLLFSSGEEFDMAYTAVWLNFYSLAQRGAFKPLDDLLPKYAPKNYAMQSEAALMEGSYNGTLYAVPTLLATYTAYGPIYRKDIVAGTEWNGKMETFEDIEAYCDIVKRDHPELQPLDIYSQGSEWDDTYMYYQGYRSTKNATNDFLYFDPSTKTPKIKTLYEMSETPEFLTMMNRWNEKGFFPKSALADTDSTKLQNGKAALRTHNIDTYQGYASSHPEYDLSYSNFTKWVCHLPFVQDAMVISNTSKHPEQSLQLWDLITTDQEAFDKFFYGVLGTTYTLNEKGETKVTNTDLYASSDMWAARTPDLYRNAEGTPDDYKPMQQSWEEFMKSSPEAIRAVSYEAFSIDTSKIETEYASCINVHQQYWWPLELGYTDPVKGLEEYKSKMKAAGIEKVQAELQRQLDEYVSKNVK